MVIITFLVRTQFPIKYENSTALSLDTEVYYRCFLLSSNLMIVRVRTGRVCVEGRNRFVRNFFSCTYPPYYRTMPEFSKYYFSGHVLRCFSSNSISSYTWQWELLSETNGDGTELLFSSPGQGMETK